MTWSDLAVTAMARPVLRRTRVHEKRLEQLLGWRVLVVWGLLICSFLQGDAIAPLCAWLVIAGLLYAGARWSATVLRESAAALVLLDAPVLYTLRDQLPVPASVVLTLVLVAGVVTLSRALTAVLVIELIVIHTQLPGGLGGMDAAITRGLTLVALGAWVLWQSTQRESR